MKTDMNGNCEHVHKDADPGSICEDCGKPWNSEYHMSDECVNIDEDKE